MAMAAPASRLTRDLIAWAEGELRASSDSPRLDAELLLAATAGVTRASLMAYPERSLGPAEVERLAAVVARRRGGEPIAYITGRREFYSLPLQVDARVLVPRPETELLVEAALARLPRAGMRVLDLGTGSGAIALAIARQRPDLAVTAADISAAALEVASANADALGIGVRLVRSDWFEAFNGERFDLIVSNPPYVASDDPHLEGTPAHEPRLALDGGRDGLDACRRILVAADAHLAPGGRILLEHGFDQREALARLAADAGFALEAALDDLAGLPRVACLTRKPVSDTAVSDTSGDARVSGTRVGTGA